MPRTTYTPRHVRERCLQRDNALRRLGHTNYEAYLHSADWRARKRLYAEQRPWICNLCGAEDSLQLHHTTYERVGREDLDDLMPLCADCHATVHALERRGDAGLNPEAVIDEARALIGRHLLARQKVEREVQDAQARQSRREEIEALGFDDRLRRARLSAKLRHVDISRQVWLLGTLISRRRAPKILWRQLERIERAAYGPEYWGEDIAA